jgi:hypothetical protein
MNIILSLSSYFSLFAFKLGVPSELISKSENTEALMSSLEQNRKKLIQSKRIRSCIKGAKQRFQNFPGGYSLL